MKLRQALCTLSILLLFQQTVNAAGILQNQGANRVVAQLNVTQGYNTFFTFRDMSVDYIRFDSTYVKLNDTTISLMPIDNSRVDSFVDKILSNKTINISSTAVVVGSLGNYSPSANVSIDKNGVYQITYLTDPTGTLHFSTAPGNAQYVFWEGAPTFIPLTSGGGGGAPGKINAFVFDLEILDQFFTTNQLKFNFTLKNAGNNAGDVRVSYNISREGKQVYYSDEQLFIRGNSECSMLECPHNVVLSQDDICNSPGNLEIKVFNADQMGHGEVYASANKGVCVVHYSWVSYLILVALVIYILIRIKRMIFKPRD
jgi:hypothetical protein